MIVADYLEYIPLKSLDQGSTKYCTSYTFFGLFQEFIQQKFKKDVEFDYEDAFKRMEKYRTTHLDKRGNRMLRIETFLSLGQKSGWADTNGDIYRIVGWRRIASPKQREVLCREMQHHSPALIGVKRFYGHSLNDTTIKPVDYENMKEKKVGHAMWLRGFDKEKEQYILQNSWGKGYTQYIPMEVFEDIGKYCYFIYDVIKEK